MMNYQYKTRKDLIKELHELQMEHASLKASCEKEITEREQVEEALKFIRLILDNAVDAMACIDYDGRYIDVNNAFCRSVGYSREELLSMTVHDIDPNYPAGIWPGFMEKLKQAGSLNFESLHRTSEGKLIPVEITVSFFEHNGKEYHCGFARDITKRKQAEETIRDLARFPSENPDPVLRIDRSGQLLYANEASYKLLTWKIQIGEKVPSVLQKIVAEALKEGIRKIIDTEHNQQVISFSIVPVEEAGYANLYGRDITDRKQAEEELRKSKELFEKTFSSQRDAIFILDAKTPPTIIDCNPATMEIFGYTGQEMLGLTTAFLHVDEIALRMFQERLQSAIAERGFLHMPEFEMRRKDGTIFATEHSVMPLKDEKGNRIGWVSVIRDIFERKRVENTLQENMYLLKKSQEIAHLGSWEFDLIKDHLTWSDEVYRIFGISPQEFSATNEAFLDAVHPEDRTAIDAAYKESLRKNQDSYENEHRIIRKNTGEIRYVHERCENIRDASGRFIRSVGIVQDITERKQAEMALRESEEKYRELIDNMGEGVGIIDSEENFVFTNQAAEKIFGVGHGGLVGTALHRFLSPENLELVIKQTNERRKRISSIYEHEIILSSGIKKHIIITATPKLGSNGEFLGTFAIFRDITKRRQAEKALRDSEDRFRRLYQQAPLGYQSLDAEGCFIDVNQAWLDLLRYSRDEVIGRWFGDFLAPQEVDAFKQRFTCFKATGEVHVDLEMVQRTGSKIIVHIDGKIGHDEHGQFKQTHCILHDITERKQAEEALRASEMKLKTLFEVLPIGVSILDAERNIAFVNPALERIMNMTRDGFIRGDYKSRKYLRPDGTQMPEEEFASVRAFREQREVHDVETGVLMEDGHVIWTNVNAAPVAFPDWKVVIITTDITERKLTQETLRESEERFRRLSQGLFEGIIIHDEGKIIDTNEAFAAMSGYDLSELIGKNVLDFATPELREIAEHHIRTESEEPYEGMSFRKEGSMLYVEVRSKNIPYKGRMVRVTALVDITERKKAEEELRESEEKYRILVESMGEGVGIVDNEENFVFANSAAEKIFGVGSGRLVGTALHRFLSPENLELVIKQTNKRQKRISSTYEHEIILSGGVKKNIIITATPKLGNNGEFLGTFAIFRDITEHKLADEALKNLLSLTEATLESIHNGILVISLQRTVIKTNAKFAEMWRIPRDILNSGDDKTLLDNVLGQLADPDAFIDKVEELYEKPEAESFDLIYFKDGRIFERISRPIFLRGEPKGRVWSFLDITERKEADEALRLEKENFRHSLDDSPLGVRIATINGNTIYANKALLDFYGYDSLGELQKIPLKDRYTPESYTQAQKRKHQREHGDLSATDYEISIVRKNGEIRHLQVFRKEVLWDDVRQFQVICNDITERKLAEEALHKSEERFRNITEQVTDVIYMTDKRGHITYISPSARSVFGYSHEEMISMPFVKFLVKSEVPKAMTEYNSSMRSGQKRKNLSFLMKHKDRSTFAGELTTNAFYENDIVTGSIGVIRNITERLHAEEEIRKSKRLLEDLHKHLNEVLENERALISREIHDQIGQSLTALKLDLNWMYKYVSTNPEAVMKLDRMIELVSNTINDVQRISSDLRPGILDDLGLATTIEWYSGEFEKRTGIKCSLRLDDSIFGDSQKNLIFFRVLQEALTNVIRHANASSVTIKLHHTPKGTTLTIQDNGIGITREKVESAKSLGLIGMRERVRQFEGKVGITSGKGQGTKLIVFIPEKKKSV